MIFILELLGTIAFAVSGAMVAIEKRMDLLGVILLGMTTAVGGGIIRDLILGSIPPSAFVHPVYALTAIGVSILVFFPRVRRVFTAKSHLYDLILRVIDSLGLGVFTAVGVQAAFTALTEPTLFLAVFVGVLTGVGGGVLRDLFAGSTPYIMVKHFYATASFVGALLCALLWPFAGQGLSTLIGAGVVVVLRLMAAHYRWKLPRAK
ncbi:MAG: TRIC cation channel family protein [Oscillospiraceae bacterium]|nr:TRIC cation channel family protein [Oscillospiraceae bacterium]